jgi:fatty acid synthase subunit alpha
MRTLTTSVTRSLCDQIFTSPIHWTLATDFPDTATHVIDFGPGGLNGIGPLTARNLDGRGVRVITLGDKGRGEAELFDIEDVQYEEWWSKKYAPKLIKTRYVNYDRHTS